MKKLLVMLFVATLFASAFAGPFGDLIKNVDGLTGAKSEVVSGNLPEGREILPALWAFTHQEIKPDDKKVVGVQARLTKINVIDKDYQFVYKIYFKFGSGVQCQESVLKIASDEKTFSIQTVDMTTVPVDKNLEPLGPPNPNPAKSMTKNTQNFIQIFEDMISSFSEEDYNKWNEAALYDFETQLGVTKYAANKLKMKRWYEAHPLKGREVSIPFYFTTLDESKVKGFEYELSGLCGHVDTSKEDYRDKYENTVRIIVYSNNDAYLDTKDNQVLMATGVVRDVRYNDLIDYKISSIIIEEK